LALRIGKVRLGFFKTVGDFLAERSLAFGAKISLRAVVVALGSDRPQLAADGVIFLQQLFGVESEFRSSVVRHDLGSIIYLILAVNNSKKRYDARSPTAAMMRAGAGARSTTPKRGLEFNIRALLDPLLD
jgi:hypothetical protein